MIFIAVIMAVVMVLVAMVGTIVHTLTIFALRQWRNINNLLDPTTHRLMTSLAVCDLLLCGTAIPLQAWNIAVGDSWPFTITGLCYYSQFWVYNLSFCSFFHMSTISIVRFLAVFKPAMYNNMLKSRVMRICVAMVPWLLGNAWGLVGLVCNMYRCRFDPTVNSCIPQPVDLKPASVNRYLGYTVASNVCSVIAPIVVGCALYACVLVKLGSRRKQQERRIQIVVALPPGSTAPIPHSTASRRQPPANKTMVTNPPAGESGKSIATRSYNTVRVIAVACFANLFLFCPGSIMFTLSLYIPNAFDWTYVIFIVYMVYYAAYCATPFVYFASSKDMRAAYLTVIKRVCWCFRVCSKSEEQKKLQIVAATNVNVMAPAELKADSNV